MKRKKKTPQRMSSSPPKSERPASPAQRAPMDRIALAARFPIEGSDRTLPQSRWSASVEVPSGESHIREEEPAS